MTKPIKTRKKLLLFLAILYLFLGLFFTLAGCVSGNLLCFLLSCIIFFPASILLFVQLFLLGKKILYTEEGICIHVPFQRVYTVFWTEIECLMRVDLRDLSNSDSGKTSLARTQNTEPSHYILISKSRKRICEIKEDDKNFEKVQMLLATYAIPTLDIAALLTDGDDVFRYLPALPFLTKCSCLFELHAQTTLEQFRGSVSLDTIKKVRKRLRILGWLLIPAGIFSSFLEGKLYFLAPVLILVTLWFVYIYFYPYIYLLQGHLLPYETPDSELDYYILPLPVMGGFFTLFFSINYIKKPKPNGYRSLHLIISVPIFLKDEKRDMKVEVQLRTIAMDFWASLEHKIRYKKNLSEDLQKELAEELLYCANQSAELDMKMQKIRNKI